MNEQEPQTDRTEDGTIQSNSRIIRCVVAWRVLPSGLSGSSWQSQSLKNDLSHHYLCYRFMLINLEVFLAVAPRAGYAGPPATPYRTISHFPRWLRLLACLLPKRAAYTPLRLCASVTLFNTRPTEALAPLFEQRLSCPKAPTAGGIFPPQKRGERERERKRDFFWFRFRFVCKVFKSIIPTYGRRDRSDRRFTSRGATPCPSSSSAFRARLLAFNEANMLVNYDDNHDHDAETDTDDE